VIRFGPLKRLLTMEQQRLDCLDAERVFVGHMLEFEDLRRDYREVRTAYLVLLEGRMVVIIYTHRSFPVRSFQCARPMQEKQLRFCFNFS
jgi:hypothetical protein